MGLGVGHLVSHHTGLIEGHTYLHFVAPGLLAITAMQLGVSESLWPILGAVKWVRSYHAAISTPLEPEDIVIGKLAWVSVRLFMTTAIYSIIILLFGATTSWWSFSLPLIGVLTGLAFAAPLMAFALTVQSDLPFATVYRFLVMPMFLFSATFYPLHQYPMSLRWIVQVMPLYHGVALARSAAFGQGSLTSTLGHLAVLLICAMVGVGLARRYMRRRLVV